MIAIDVIDRVVGLDDADVTHCEPTHRQIAHISEGLCFGCESQAVDSRASSPPQITTARRFLMVLVCSDTTVEQYLSDRQLSHAGKGIGLAAL